MSTAASPRDPELWRRVIPVARDAFRQVSSRIEEGFRFERRSQFPSFDRDVGEFPRFSSGSGPENFCSVFAAADSYHVEVTYGELEGYGDLINYAQSLPSSLQEFLLPPRITRDRFRDHLYRVQVMEIVLEPLERMLHQVGARWDEEVLLSGYLLIEAWWFEHNDLPVELFVPILGVTFDAEKFDLGDSIYVERMSDDYQLARWPSDWRSLEHAEAMSKASHALIIPGFSVHYPDALARLAIADSPGEVPQVTLFFSALAACTTAPSGYAQVLSRPVGWAPAFRAHLPSLELSLPMRRYPDALRGEDALPADRLVASQIDLLKTLYGQLRDGGDHLHLAAERLSMAQYRQDESDRLIDLCVAIEALIGDRQPGELNFKLRVRAAAILAPEFDPREIFRWVGKIYGSRSRLVHGSSADRSSRFIRVNDDEYPVDVVADMVVRELLKRILINPILTATVIDQRILRALGGVGSLLRTDGDDGG